MSFLGLGTPVAEQSNTRQTVTQAILFGGGIAGSGAVVFSAFELIRSNPDKGFALLERWGPWFFLAVFTVWVLNGLLNRLLDVFSELGGRFAGSMDRIADEQTKLAKAGQDQAEAMQRSADKDDRDHERMATLVDYSGQQSRQAAEAVTAMHEMMLKMVDKVDAMAARKEVDDGH